MLPAENRDSGFGRSKLILIVSKIERTGYAILVINISFSTGYYRSFDEYEVNWTP